MSITNINFLIGALFTCFAASVGTSAGTIAGIIFAAIYFFAHFSQ